MEFKTGPQNPDFRECLAQLLDYGSDLWGMSLEEFETRVARRYFEGPHCPTGTVPAGASLDQVLEKAWSGTIENDAVGWQERLQAQLRDGSFHYIAVAQRFTPPVLRTLRYLNATTKGARFSAVELVRFAGDGHAAFEARFVAGAEPAKGTSAAGKTALAGVDELLSTVSDDDYRHSLQDLFDALVAVEGLTVFWGTTGCSLRVAIPGRNPLSVGWIFPPGPPRWMGLSDATLGWYEDSHGLVLPEPGRAALADYLTAVGALGGAKRPRSEAIQGFTFAPADFVAHVPALAAAIHTVVSALSQA